MPDYTGSLIDHLNIAVPNLDRSIAFYEPTLATLGIRRFLDAPARPDGPDGTSPLMQGFGWEHKPFFWLVADGTGGDNMHLAFTAPHRAAVRAFYEAALAAGGTSRIAPGVRDEYHPDYYGAFVLDPDGINLEAVCHRPE